MEAAAYLYVPRESASALSFSLSITKDYLTLLGLTNDRRAVVLADNRGLMQGSDDDGYIIDVNADGFTAKNLTIINYCNADYEYPGDPGKNLKKAGEAIVVPAVVRAPARRAVRVVVSKSRRTVTVYGAGDRMLAQYPATMGGEHDPLPIGHWTITSVQHDPWFYYDPVHFWNASPNEAAAKLPPGPRNPAGVVWMGLSKAHYGIHGTPDPGRIRHGESAGCIRLTNWDAADLSHMVLRGTPAILEE